mmetsp:Transcript_25465/g.37216  ORF Transcript_25465/g.37216 Transcript_25465/m.37216 type:complete len:234 (-) Transcript_25465:2625-3326(-)
MRFFLRDILGLDDRSAGTLQKCLTQATNHIRHRMMRRTGGDTSLTWNNTRTKVSITETRPRVYSSSCCNVLRPRKSDTTLQHLSLTLHVPALDIVRQSKCGATLRGVGFVFDHSGMNGMRMCNRSACLSSSGLIDRGKFFLTSTLGCKGSRIGRSFRVGRSSGGSYSRTNIFCGSNSSTRKGCLPRNVINKIQITFFTCLLALLQSINSFHQCSLRNEFASQTFPRIKPTHNV